MERYPPPPSPIPSTKAETNIFFFKVGVGVGTRLPQTQKAIKNILATENVAARQKFQMQTFMVKAFPFLPPPPKAFKSKKNIL